MCVIIHLLPGKTIEHLKLFNAAANNWHSWGIVVKDEKKKKLTVIQRVPKNAELKEDHVDAGGCHNDIEEIEKILDDNKKFERFIHFRHATKGHVNIENCHPKLIYEGGNRQVYFMHNGTFGGGLGVTVNGYGMTYGPQGVKLDKAPSDTYEFAEKHLMEPLEAFVEGDYTNEKFQKYLWNPLFIDKGQASRVIFISNDLPCLKAGSWSTFTNNETQEVDFYASNNTYFDKVDRGPLHEAQKAEERRQKAAQEAKEKSERVEGNLNASTAIVPYQHGMFQQDPKVLVGLRIIFDTFGAGLASNEIRDLGECSVPEFEAIINQLLSSGNTNSVAFFMDLVVQSYMELYNDHERLKDKHDKATKKISSLVIEGSHASKAA